MIDKFFKKFNYYINLLNQNSFLKNVIFVSGGTIFAQLLVLLFSPVISRIYSAEDFGVFQQYQAILSFLLVISGLRYEMAIMVTKDKNDSISLLFLSIFINIIFSLLIFIIILLLQIFGYSFSFLSGMINLVYFIPFALFGASLYQSLNNMIIREREFKKIGITKMLQSTGLVSGQVIIGGLIDKKHGLIWGDLLSKFLGISTFIRVLLINNKDSQPNYSWSRLKFLGYKYKKFPLLSVPSGLINVAGLTMPTFLIGNYFGLTVLGLYALVDRIFAAPTMLIGHSISQVYMGDFVEMSNSNPSALLLRFKNLIKKVSLLAILPYSIAAVLAPFLFGWLFGEDWSEAGIYFAILAPMQFASIIVWPLIPTLNLLEKQNWQFYWDLIRLLFVISILTFAHFMNFSPRLSIFLFGVVMFIAYLLHLVMSLLAIKIRIKQYNDLNINGI